MSFEWSGRSITLFRLGERHGVPSPWRASLVKEPPPGANAWLPRVVFPVPAPGFAIRTANLLPQPFFWFPDGRFAWMARFLVSRTVIFLSRLPIWRPGSSSFFPNAHLRNPGRRVAIRGVIFVIRAAGIRFKPSSCFLKAHPRSQGRHPVSESSRTPTSSLAWSQKPRNGCATVSARLV